MGNYLVKEEEEKEEEDEEEDQTTVDKLEGSRENTVIDQSGNDRLSQIVSKLKLIGDAEMSKFHKPESGKSESDDDEAKFLGASLQTLSFQSKTFSKVPTFIQLPSLPPPPAPPPPDFLDDMNPGALQQPYAHVNYPAVRENVGDIHNVVQQVLPGPQPHQHPAPPPPDLLD